MKLEKLESHFCIISTLECTPELLATGQLAYSTRYSIAGTSRIRPSSGILATMTRVLILSVVLGICCALAEKSDTTTTEHPKGLANSEDRFLVNVIHGKNSSELGDADEEEKKTDKKPRTVLHRLDSSDRDKSMYFRFLSSPESKARRIKFVGRAR